MLCRSARGCYLSNTGTTLGVPRTANMDCMAPVTHTHYFGIISDADAEGPREQVGGLHQLFLCNQNQVRC